jgi:polyferredoxin
MAAHVVHWRLAGRTLAPLELNEVMYTLELGIVTAGFLFMSAAVLATMIFGRFFCSWACHILALEDLAAWLFEKLGVRARPVRSRMLLLVPPFAMFYMFVWPQAARFAVGRWPSAASLLGRKPEFTWRIAGDAEGWASFATTDFWRNLPGPWIALLTFFVCGFVIVYLLGSRSFCRYACPYGAVFGMADRVAPGRILLRGNCTNCGLCTAGCKSDIRVHEEVQKFGRVVSSRCLKDLDCVSVCPTGGLEFGFARPSGLLPWLAKDAPRHRYEFSVAEEVLIAATFAATVLIYRGLYSAVPFLVTLGLGGVFAFLAVWTFRSIRQHSLWLHKMPLKIAGRLTLPGRFFVGGVALVAAFSLHSGFVRWHEMGAAWALGRMASAPSGAGEPAALDAAAGHLRALAHWGLCQEHEVRFRLAWVLTAQGRDHDARLELERVAAKARNSRLRADAHDLAASICARAGDLDGTIRELRSVLAEDSGRVRAQRDLAALLESAGVVPPAGSAAADSR